MLKNKTFGSALIIAGTTIGAGMLAMPLTSAGIGFGYTVLLLVGLWALLVYSGLLFVEVYQTADRLNDGVATLAEKYFGITGRVLATFSLLILLYALSAAYITGAAHYYQAYQPLLALKVFPPNFQSFYLPSYSVLLWWWGQKALMAPLVFCLSAN